MLAILALIAAAVAYICTLRSLQPVPSSRVRAQDASSRPQHLAFHRYPRKD